jgi:hypothetical protein
MNNICIFKKDKTTKKYKIIKTKKISIRWPLRTFEEGFFLFFDGSIFVNESFDERMIVLLLVRL